MALLTADELKAALPALDGWSGDGDSIKRTVELASFPKAIEVVDRVAEIAEGMDHHPDIDIRWRTLTLRCSTHTEGGVTAQDIDLATRINEVVAAA